MQGRAIGSNWLHFRTLRAEIPWFRVLIRVRAINVFEHWSTAWARSRFQRCLRPPCSFPDQRIRIGETAGKIIE